MPKNRTSKSKSKRPAGSSSSGKRATTRERTRTRPGKKKPSARKSGSPARRAARPSHQVQSRAASRPSRRREEPATPVRSETPPTPAAGPRAPRPQAAVTDGDKSPATRAGSAPRRVPGADEHYRQKLLASRADIIKNLEELRDELRGLQEPSHELEEWAQEEKERDILILQEQRQEGELARIQVALERLEEGTYGLCARCGRRISKERLEEVPTAVFCRNCQP